jgi:4-amino-4-deoxy-L-arabinose transferase-like glycosyltransferase
MNRTRIADLLSAVVIAVAVLVIGGPHLATGGLGWSDAPQHTFDGIFVLECLKQWPVHDLRAWAEQFYVRHPALGIFVYWPPAFAVVEAAMFALLGVNIVTARATVLLFAWAAGWLVFVLGRRWFDRPTGLLAASLLITCPHGALWLSDVMLEWPATFWILAAVYAYQKDRDTRRTGWCVLLGFCLLTVFLTKQTAGFILPVLLVHAIVCPGRRAYLLRPAFIVSLGLSIGLIVGYWLATRRYTALPASLLRPSLDLLYYPRHLPEILGWPLVPVALLGVGTFLLEPDRKARALLLLWLAAWYIFSATIAAKEPRYFFFALVPLMFAAVRFFLPAGAAGRSEPALTVKSDAARVALLVALVCTQAVLARVKSTGRLPDYADAVSQLASIPDADLVLVDAVRDGQFVFDVYRNPAARRIIPLRASKVLYARAARSQYGYQQLVRDADEILDLLNKYGIRYIVIESWLPKTAYTDADPAPRQMLRQLLAEDDRFVLLGRWPLRCGDPAWDDVELRLYAYPDCPKRKGDRITFPFPGMGREVTFHIP